MESITLRILFRTRFRVRRVEIRRCDHVSCHSRTYIMRISVMSIHRSHRADGTAPTWSQIIQNDEAQLISLALLSTFVLSDACSLSLTILFRDPSAELQSTATGD